MVFNYLNNLYQEALNLFWKLMVAQPLIKTSISLHHWQLTVLWAIPNVSGVNVCNMYRDLHRMLVRMKERGT